MPINTNLMTDEGTSVARKVTPSTKTPMSIADAEAASAAAGQELGLTPLEIQAAATDISQITKTAGETNAAFNTRLTQAYKDLSPQPELTDAEVAGGATIQWTRTGASGQGEYKVVYPVGGLKTSSGGSTNGSAGGNGSSASSTSGNSSGVSEISDVTKDAFAGLTDLFTSYGLGSLSGEIADYMTHGYTANEALIKLKTNPTGAYAERFAGNFARAKAGLNVLTESDYIANETSYANTLKSYGLGDMLSADPKANWKTFSTYIANDISPVEFKDRIAIVEDRVINADAETKALFKQWYPSLTDKDLVAYFLNPTETIGKLKEKVTSSEIGAAFTGQGLGMDMASATDYAKYGIDRAGALQGAKDIKDVLPVSSKLSNIYQEAGINYTQKTGEAEFLKTNADAAEQRRRLKSMERGKFMGDSGVSSQAGSLTKTTQGIF